MNFERLLKFEMIGSLGILALGCLDFWLADPQKGTLNEGWQNFFIGISALLALAGFASFIIGATCWLVAFLISRLRRN